MCEKKCEQLTCEKGGTWNSSSCSCECPGGEDLKKVKE